tara:strand:+ start:1984 stop:2394 length:411 start_codon:yes stop_codon:yes gene_type:complete
MKITKTRLKEVILEVIKEEEKGQPRETEEIFQDVVTNLTALKDRENGRELLLGILDTITNVNEGQHMMGGIDADDHEVEMALSDLHKLEKYAPEVAHLASQYSNLPGWVQSKITLAADYLGKVYHYLDGKHNKGME